MPRTIVRERNEHGLVVFLDSVRSILIGVQNLEVNGSSMGEVETALLRLEESASTLVLISEYVGTSTNHIILNNFKSTVDALLTKIRTLCQILTSYIDATQDARIEFSYMGPLVLASRSWSSQDSDTAGTN